MRWDHRTRNDGHRRRREAEAAEHRRDMFEKHRQDMLLDDDGDHWVRN